MHRQTLRSTSLRSAQYDPSTQSLHIEFTSGQIYRYLHVPTQIYYGLINAPSHGEFFNDQIRDHYEHIHIK